MPFRKVGRDEYESPSGRKFTKKQVDLYYAGGGHFPGQSGMRDQFPKSYNSATARTLTRENSEMRLGGQSPSAKGTAERPTLRKSGREEPLSSTPTSILASGPSTFGPLEYATRDKSAQGFWNPEDMARREVRRARREYNRRNGRE